VARNLTLPKDRLSDLKTLVDLGPDGLRRVTKSLLALKPFPLVLPEFRRSLEDLFVEQQDIVTALVRLLLHFYRLRLFNGWTAKEIVEALRAAVNRAKETAWSPDHRKRWGAIEEPLIELLNIEQISVLAKALDLTYAHPHLFSAARILTDVRPVFSEDARSINAAVVSFALHLDFYGPEGSRSLALGMDRKDVEELQRKCQRAITKAETAKAVISDKVGIPVALPEAEA
jgi:hypothetical protein